MESFLITPCTIADGPAIGRNNVTAFWTDRTWIQIWGDRTREHVAEQAAMRGRRNLLLDRAHRRHLKAVDAETGAVVGYARWVLPDEGCDGGDGDPCHGLWTEAQIPDVDEHVRREAEAESARSDWTFTRGPIDGIDAPIEAMMADLRKGKRYMGMFVLIPTRPGFHVWGLYGADNVSSARLPLRTTGVQAKGYCLGAGSEGSRGS